jgi:subtilase family serine protease
MDRVTGQVMGKPVRPRISWGAGLVLGVLTGTLVVATLGAGAAAASPAASMKAVGSAPRLPAGARILGPAAASTTLRITVALRSQDPAGLQRLAQQVSTPSSARYRGFLSGRQVQARFGPPAGVLAALRSWLRGHGFAVRPASGDGLTIPASGSVGDIEKTFQTPIRRVRLASGRIAHVNSRPPAVPARLRSRVAAVVGLDNLVLPESDLASSPAMRPGPAGATSARRPPARRSSARRSSAGQSSAGNRACAAASATPAAFTAGEVAHAYSFGGLYRRGDLGQGVTVALFELANYADSDIGTYTRCYRISPSVRRVRVDGGTTIGASPQSTVEATADIETLTGMAPRARVLVYEAPAALGLEALVDNYASIAQQDRAQVVSSSYGICEPYLIATDARVARVEAMIFQAMAVQGQSMLAASGDAGSEQCLPMLAQLGGRAYQLAVGDPASQPFVTAVGGTAITSYGSPPVETTWNQAGSQPGTGFPAPFNGLNGRPKGYPGNRVGSGGISGLWPMPAWQRGFDTSGNSSGSPCGAPQGADCREVPDVSALAAAQLTATPGYAIYGTAGEFHGRGWISAGGTSLATPLWAALSALADQRTPGHRLGLLSPALYRIRQADPGAFSDVTIGDNNYLAPDGSPNHDTCTYQGAPRQPCYEATPGYDMATGLGSPRARLLATDLARGHQLRPPA